VGGIGHRFARPPAIAGDQDRKKADGVLTSVKALGRAGMFFDPRQGIQMTQDANAAAMPLAAAALACWVSSAAFAATAVWTHLSLSALGPICGLTRPGEFFLHCPACPAALASALLGSALCCGLLVGPRRPA
jgi:hypothetical protein